MLPALNLCCAASLYFELSKKILVLLKISNTHFLNPGHATVNWSLLRPHPATPPPPPPAPHPPRGTQRKKQFNARKEENQVHVCLLA